MGAACWVMLIQGGSVVELGWFGTARSGNASGSALTVLTIDFPFTVCPDL
jgi:hypothetical protein